MKPNKSDELFSIFTVIWAYIKDAIHSGRSVVNSFFAAIPYLFGAGELRKEVTEQYPDPVSSRTVMDLPTRSRGVLHNQIDVCIGCHECEKACPSRCISIETELSLDPKRLWISKFDIDLSRCVYCGICAEICPVESLKHTREFEVATDNKEDLILPFGKGSPTPEQRAQWKILREQKNEEDVRVFKL